MTSKLHAPIRAWKHRYAAAVIALAALAGAASQPARASTCGMDEKVTIAEMTWLSAAAMAHITDRILSNGYGCKTEIVPGDTVPTASSLLSKGEPMIVPELWMSTLGEIWAKIQAKGIAFKAGDAFTSGGNEGWFIPDYVAKANPELKSVADLPKFAKLFEEPASNGKGRLYACPPGWACEITNTNLFKAAGLGDKGFELFSPGSGANLKASIARKITRKQPLLTYYWGPTEVIGKYNLVKLDMGPFDQKRFDCIASKDCEKPQLTDFKNSEIAVVAATGLKKKAPAVAEYLSKMQIPNDTVNSMLAWGDDESASPGDIATYFLKEHEDIWTKWVPADVASKVKATLK